MWNYFESLWMLGFEFLWVVFLIVAAEIGRYWQPLPLPRAAYGSRTLRPGNPALSRATQRPWLRIPTKKPARNSNLKLSRLAMIFLRVAALFERTTRPGQNCL
jgi:hypothetical protein